MKKKTAKDLAIDAINYAKKPLSKDEKKFWKEFIEEEEEFGLLFLGKQAANSALMLLMYCQAALYVSGLVDKKKKKAKKK
jgi:hypothetical protein